MRKLSDIHGEEAMELTAMLVSIGRKVNLDKGLKKYLGKPDIPKGMSERDFQNVLAEEFLNSLLLRHRKDCIMMLAKIDGVSEEEYLASADPLKITKDIGDLMSDSIFHELFFGFVQSQ